jgi:hypothetical protein
MGQNSQAQDSAEIGLVSLKTRTVKNLRSLVFAFMVGSVTAVAVLPYYFPYRTNLGVSKPNLRSTLTVEICVTMERQESHLETCPDWSIPPSRW